MGVGVLSGLIAVWCGGRETGLIREEVRENMSLLSSLTVSPVLSLQLCFPLFSLLFLTLYMTTQNDGSPAWLINWQRETDRHKGMRKERGDVERAAHRLL